MTNNLLYSVIQVNLILCFFAPSFSAPSRVEYHDHSQDTRRSSDVPCDLQHVSTTALQNPQEHPSRQREKNTFPWILYNMLERSDDIHMSDIIGFQPHGRCIKIHNRNRFQQEILPRFFPKQSNIASFQRQLSLYGFLRMVKDGPDQNSYYHEMFLQGRPEIIDLMTRKIKKGNMVRHLYDPSSEPNFYAIAPIQSYVPPQPSNVIDAAEQVAASVEANHQGYDDSKPEYRSRQIMPLYSINDSAILPPQNNNIGTASDVARLFPQFPMTSVTIPQISQYTANSNLDTSTSLLTLAQPQSDTRNTIITCAHPTSATATTDLHPISIFGPPAIPVVQTLNIDPLPFTNNHCNVTMPQISQYTASSNLGNSSSLLTLAQPQSDTRNTIIAYAHPTSATTNTGLDPISIFGLPAVPIVQTLRNYQHPFTTNHINILPSNQLPTIALQPPQQIETTLPQFQAAMQLYNETLNEYYRLRNQLNHPSLTIPQPHAAHTNELMMDQPTNRMWSQEEYPNPAQMRYAASTSHNVPNTGLLERPNQDTGVHWNSRNHNLNTHTGYDGIGSTHSGFYDINDGGAAAADLIGGNHDIQGEDGSVSDESLNRDWGYPSQH